MRISEVANLTGVNGSDVRFYENKANSLIKNKLKLLFWLFGVIQL